MEKKLLRLPGDSGSGDPWGLGVGHAKKHKRTAPVERNIVLKTASERFRQAPGREKYSEKTD